MKSRNIIYCPQSEDPSLGVHDLTIATYREGVARMLALDKAKKGIFKRKSPK